MKIIAMGNLLFSIGFMLAGLPEVYIVNEDDFPKQFEEKFYDPNVGIIIVQDMFLNKLGWKMKKEIDKRAAPVVISINLEGREVKGESIDSLVKKALGFELKKGD